MSLSGAPLATMRLAIAGEPGSPFNPGGIKISVTRGVAISARERRLVSTLHFGQQRGKLANQVCKLGWIEENGDRRPFDAEIDACPAPAGTSVGGDGRFHRLDRKLGQPGWGRLLKRAKEPERGGESDCGRKEETVVAIVWRCVRRQVLTIQGYAAVRLRFRTRRTVDHNRNCHFSSPVESRSPSTVAEGGAGCTRRAPGGGR